MDTGTGTATEQLSTTSSGPTTRSRAAANASATANFPWWHSGQNAGLQANSTHCQQFDPDRCKIDPGFRPSKFWCVGREKFAARRDLRSSRDPCPLLAWAPRGLAYSFRTPPTYFNQRMKLIVWGALLAVTLLGGPAAVQSCRPLPIGADRRNLAFGKPTYQSSTYPNMHGGPSAKAVDGDCHGIWTHASCTHTNLEANPWWFVDLGESYKIHTVVVKNREDCCSQRLLGAEVHLGDSLENNGKFNHLCGIIQDSSLGSISNLYCNNNRGRYISIHLPREDYLTVCEVEVYGTK